MRIRVGKRAKAVIILLTGSIPKLDLDLAAVYRGIHNIGLEYGWYKHLREHPSGKNPEKGCFPWKV
jgi:hypothetical protein